MHIEPISSIFFVSIECPTKKSEECKVNTDMEIPSKIPNLLEIKAFLVNSDQSSMVELRIKKLLRYCWELESPPLMNLHMRMPTKLLTRP